jgi:hypothetical protein
MQAQFFNGHSMIEPSFFTALDQACTNATDGEWFDEATAPAACLNALTEMNVRAGTYDVYNVYDTCVAGDRAVNDQATNQGSFLAPEVAPIGHHKTYAEWRKALFKER